MSHRATRRLSIGIMLIVTGLVFGSAGPVSAEVVLCKSAWSKYVKARHGSCRWRETEILLPDTLADLSCSEDQIARYVGGQWECSDGGLVGWEIVVGPTLENQTSPYLVSADCPCRQESTWRRCKANSHRTRLVLGPESPERRWHRVASTVRPGCRHGSALSVKRRSLGYLCLR